MQNEQLISLVCCFVSPLWHTILNNIPLWMSQEALSGRWRGSVHRRKQVDGGFHNPHIPNNYVNNSPIVMAKWTETSSYSNHPSVRMMSVFGSNQFTIKDIIIYIHQNVTRHMDHASCIIGNRLSAAKHESIHFNDTGIDLHNEYNYTLQYSTAVQVRKCMLLDEMKLIPDFDVVFSYIIEFSQCWRVGVTVVSRVDKIVRSQSTRTTASHLTWSWY